MILVVDPSGQARCLYDECIDLAALGTPIIRRGSHVEPDGDGHWWADLAPVRGPKLGPCERRSEALDAERAWLESYWLNHAGNRKEQPLADFIPTTASNDPKINDHEAVERIIAAYYFDPDFNVGVGFDPETGLPYLFMYGYVWPEAWKLAQGVSRQKFDPYGNDLYEEGDDGFEQFLKDIAPYLAEPLTVQAIGAERCRFPLAASEWHVAVGDTEVETTGFRHSYPEPIVVKE